MTVAPIPGFSEPFSSLSHLVAAGVFLLPSFPLLMRGRGSTGRVVSLAVFALGAVFLLSMSGIYHLLTRGTAGWEVLRRLDHAAIFVLIAASFTPAHAILFRGVGRWGMLCLIWTIAIAAIVCKTVWFEEMPHWMGLVLYLGMGWIGLFSGVALWRRYGFRFIEPVLLGGLAYSVGALLDYLEWPVLIPGVIGSHEVFHVAVLIGLAFHWSFTYVIADGRLRPRESSPNPASSGRSNQPADGPEAAGSLQNV